MTSKNSYWKHSKLNFKKRSPYLVLMLLACFFLMPVVAYMTCNSAIQYDRHIEYIASELFALCFTGSGVHPLIAGGMAFILAISGNMWNNNRSKVDFYKSLPVKESDRFIYIAANNLLIFELSFIVNMLLTLVAVAINGFFRMDYLYAALLSILINSLLFVAIYSVVYVAQLLTGNIALAAIGGGVLLVVEIGARFLLLGFKDEFFKTAISSQREIVDSIQKAVTSPFGPYYKAIESVSYSVNDLGEKVNFSIHGLIPACIHMLIIALVMMYIAYVLYKNRPAHNASGNIVFEKSKVYIKCLISVPLILLAALFFSSLVYKHQTAYGLFGFISGLIVTHIVMQIAIEGNFTAIRTGIKGLVASAVISLAVFTFFSADLANYDKYLPDSKDIESISISLDNEYVNDYFDDEYLVTYDYVLDKVRIDDKEVIDTWLSLIKDSMDKDMYTYDAEWIEESHGIECSTLSVAYHLNNGRDVKRQYTISLDYAKEIHTKLYNNRAYREMTNRVSHMKIAERENCYVDVVFSPVGLRHTGAKDISILGFENQKVFLETLEKDINNRTADCYMESVPIGDIRVSIQNSKTYRSMDWYDIFIYPEDTATVNILRDLGYKEYEIEKDLIKSIHIESMYDFNEQEEKIITADDPLFDEILDNCMVINTSVNVPVYTYNADHRYSISVYDEYDWISEIYVKKGIIKDNILK